MSENALEMEHYQHVLACHKLINTELFKHVSGSDQENGNENSNKKLSQSIQSNLLNKDSLYLRLTLLLINKVSKCMDCSTILKEYSDMIRNGQSTDVNNARLECDVNWDGELDSVSSNLDKRPLVRENYESYMDQVRIELFV